MQKKITINNPDGLKLSCVLHRPSKYDSKYKPPNNREASNNHKPSNNMHNPIGVVLCHGFACDKDKNFFPELAVGLSTNGFFVLRFDFSGNGQSQGLFETRTYSLYAYDLKSVVEYLKQRLGLSKIVVIGFSMGANVAVISYHLFKNFEGLILLAPAFKTVDAFSKQDMKLIDKQGFIVFKDLWGVKRKLLKQYFVDMRSHNFLSMSKSINIPTMIVIGLKDKIVDIRFCERFYRNMPKASKSGFFKLGNEGHTFHNKADKLLPFILSFLGEL